MIFFSCIHKESDQDIINFYDGSIVEFKMVWFINVYKCYFLLTLFQLTKAFINGK